MEPDSPRIHSLLEQTIAQRAARPLRAFIYARRSYDPGGLARAINDQLYAGRSTCQLQGWTVTGEFADPDNSASRHSRKARPDYEEMVKGVERGDCDVIVAWESSRLSRDITDFTRLADLCARCKVLLCLNGRMQDMRDTDDRFRAQFDALLGGYEADKIRDRNLRTMKGLAREGRPSGFTPFGYQREYDQETGELLRQYPEPEKAAIVAELTRRVAGGESLLSLAREMTARGVPTPRAGASWHPMTVRALVRRPTNIGKRVHQGRIVGDAAWDAIVEEADYHAAMKVLSDPGRRTQKETAAKYLLSGIALCPDGHRLYARAPSKGHPRGRYLCPKCFKAAIPMDTFDDLVTATVLAYVERPEFAAAFASRDPDAEAREALALATALEGELDEARRLAGTVVNGRLALSVGDFAVISAQLTAQIDEARSKSTAGAPETLRRFVGPRARAVWQASDLPQRRALIRELVRVTLNPAGVGQRQILPGRVTWDWRW